MEQPIITTNRLIMRPFTTQDGPRVQFLAGIKEIASMTVNIPHPYEDGMAEEWISSHKTGFAKGDLVVYAILLKDTNTLCGAISLMVNKVNKNAELGYWIGKPYWGNGYCTEAAKAILQYGFNVFNLHRIFALHFAKNPASGRVMQKIGMKYEGRLREHVCKQGSFEDIEQYGVLVHEWQPNP